jgi:hypothetical protein
LLEKFPFLFGRKWTIIKADAARREIQRSESFSAADNQLLSAGPKKYEMYFSGEEIFRHFSSKLASLQQRNHFSPNFKMRKYFNGILIQFHAHQISSFIILQTGWRFIPFLKENWLNSDIFGELLNFISLL